MARNECKWNDADTLVFPDGHQYNVRRCNHYGWETVDARGVRILYTELNLSLTRFEGHVEIGPAAQEISASERDLLVLLAWYIAIYKGPQYYNTYVPVTVF